MADILRVGMVSGAGIGASHITCWMSLEKKAKITAVMDVDPELAATSAHMAGDVPWTTNLDELLARDDVDAVDICSPPFVHEQQIVAAAKAGKHVLCEKPFTVNLDEAERAIAACKEAGVKLMVAFPRPFSAAARKVKDIIETGELGTPIRIYSSHHMRAEWIRKRTGWFWDPKKSGGTVIEGIIHDFHFLPWLFGPAQRIYAEAGTFLYTDREPTLPDDQVVVLWRFQNGAIGIIDGGANQPSNYGGHTSIFFTGGGIRMERGGSLRIYRGMLDYHPTVEEIHAFGPISDDTQLQTTAYHPSGHLGEISHFTDCVLEDKEPETPGEAGRYALECAWAAIKSFQTNQPVTLPLEKPYPSY